MKIAQRYMDEIEQICEGNGNIDLDDCVQSHWICPEGLFLFCRPIGSKISSFQCGCLTVIRGSGARAVDRNGLRIPLTDEIQEDDRLASQSSEILPSHLRSLTYPLTDSQKQEVRECLYPYAEWQTRLRLEFKDVPGIEAEIIEI